MARYKVNPVTVPSAGLNFRTAPLAHPSTRRGTLAPGDFVESVADPESLPPNIWVLVKVLFSPNFPPGEIGYVMLSASGLAYLVESDEALPAAARDITPAADTRALPDATSQAAALLNLPPLLLKAFMGVEGANADDRDGVLQVTPGTRSGVIARLDRRLKLQALGLAAGDAMAEADLNARFGQAFVQKNLLAQVLTGGQYIREQLNRFGNYVALAGLAYNAGPGGAQRVINQFGGDAYLAAWQYHKHIGAATGDVTVQPGVDSIDTATGAHWTRYPVTANDTGIELFQYLYLRQVPRRNYGLLDFIFRPPLLAGYRLYESEPPPGDDDGRRVLVVENGQFGFVAG